jgi:hypothetical protein
MTQEDKELLLKDISGRLPYGLVLDVDTTDWKAPQGHIQLKIEGMGILFKDMSLIVNGCYYGDNYKPYLRPMSSMTEEEHIDFFYYHYNAGLEEIKKSGDYLKAAYLSDNAKYDWLNKHHFDYRYLIERNLALEAPEGMYN